MIKNRFFTFFAMILIAASAMVSCSEDDGEVEEYPNWQAANDAYYDQLSDSVQRLIAANPDCGWKRIRTYSKIADAATSNADYIIVQLLDSLDHPEASSPLYNDTVSIHYQGRLIPSASYAKGYLFDSSFSGTYDPEVSVPNQSGTTGSFVDGFTTALLNMRRGDHWRVYIPYRLGYDSAVRSSIPAYSTLVFDIRLADFWSPKK